MYAYAKINLTLDVLGRRPDGYHEVDMILQTVDLYDELRLSSGEGGSLRLEVEGDAPATGENLVLRAAHALQEYAKIQAGAHISLVKRIPTAAGLGGGSADAAAALRGLNRLWNIHLPLETLCQIGASLGADVPFCVLEGTRRATGIGTTLTPLPSPPSMGVVICKPCEGMLTRDVYAALKLPPTRRPDTQGAVQALLSQDIKALCAAMGNVLESVTLPARPAAAQAIEALREAGAMAAQMSGSGPSVFGLFPDLASAQAAASALPAHLGFRAAVGLPSRQLVSHFTYA